MGKTPILKFKSLFFNKCVENFENLNKHKFTLFLFRLLIFYMFEKALSVIDGPILNLLLQGLLKNPSNGGYAQ